jgi:hypothetical protein
VTLQEVAFIAVQEICTIAFLRMRNEVTVSVPCGFEEIQEPFEHTCELVQAVVVTAHHTSVVCTVVLLLQTFPAVVAQGGAKLTQPCDWQKLIHPTTSPPQTYP